MVNAYRAIARHLVRRPCLHLLKYLSLTTTDITSPGYRDPHAIHCSRISLVLAYTVKSLEAKHQATTVKMMDETRSVTFMGWAMERPRRCSAWAWVSRMTGLFSGLGPRRPRRNPSEPHEGIQGHSASRSDVSVPLNEFRGLSAPPGVTKALQSPASHSRMTGQLTSGFSTL